MGISTTAGPFLSKCASRRSTRATDLVAKFETVGDYFRRAEDAELGCPILKEMGRDEVGTRFNVFRRFREAVLQRSEARQILIDYWMGHSNPSMGDRYGKQLVEDVEYRQEQVKKVGLGFDLPPSLFGLRGLQNMGNDCNKEAA
jgi:hypothetical protein